MDMMRKYIEYIVLFLFLLSCSSKVEILTGDSQYQPFAPDGIPFVVADSMWNVDMRGNHRAVVRVSDINSNTAVKIKIKPQPLRLYCLGDVQIYVRRLKKL